MFGQWSKEAAGRGAWPRWEFLAIGVFVFAALLFLLRGSARKSNQTLDFAIFYTAGKIVKQGLSHRLYEIPLQERIQRQFGQTFLPFDHAPFEALLFAPLTLFPYLPALLIWDSISIFLWGFIVWKLSRTKYRLTPFGQAVWWVLSFLLLLAVLMLGQDSMLLAVVFLLAFLAIKRGHEYSAGVWLGVGLFRFEILLPFVFIFLLRRRWKVLAGFLGASVVGLAISAGMLGWAGLMGYAKLLMHVSQSTANATTHFRAATMPTLRGIVFVLLGGIISQSFLFALVLVGSLALLVWSARQFQSFARYADAAFDLEFSLATIAALLASYVAFVHELTPLIVVAYLLLGYEGSKPQTGILGNRTGLSLLVLFTLIFGVGWLAFGFHTFSIEALVLLGMLIWLARESAAVRKAMAADGSS